MIRLNQITAFCVSFLFLILLSPQCFADTRIDIPEAGISFNLPKGWDKNNVEYGKPNAKMDQSDTFMKTWKRNPIINDVEGTSIIAGITIVAYKKPDLEDLVMYSGSVLAKRGWWPPRKFLTSKKDKIHLPNCLGFVIEHTFANAPPMKMMVIHSYHKEKFVEVTMIVTSKLYSSLEPEFLSRG